ncbi:AraC family ligand binding domain-containing protein [Paenibacillus sp. DMB5]|uniref:AraC family ligand binding domain-containing protein n=1 Tax=Paenibacillus sp. DMB5 TaxID=1780103 RepID=UPI00076C88F1|nr:AraC family ligand binding domain-containing protein [Paenibacillus sp. DMB5]KUP24401.1 hypothetical protein AWJ19_18570 [Paenibacillus sp. DMB5]
MTTKLLARDIGLEPGFTFRIQKCPLTHDYYVHSHDFSELVVILSGSAVHIIEGREYPVTAGQVFLIHSGVSHGYKNVEDIEYVNVMFQPEELLQQPELRLLPGFQALFYIEPFYRQEMYFKGMLSLDAGQLLEATRLLDLILTEHERREDGYRLMVRTYFTALVGMLSRYYQNSSGGDENKALRIGEAVTYIEEHFLQPVTLQSMADMAYMSTRQFLRVFTRNYKPLPWTMSSASGWTTPARFCGIRTFRYPGWPWTAAFTTRTITPASSVKTSTARRPNTASGSAAPGSRDNHSLLSPAAASSRWRCRRR